MRLPLDLGIVLTLIQDELVEVHYMIGWLPSAFSLS